MTAWLSGMMSNDARVLAASAQPRPFGRPRPRGTRRREPPAPSSTRGANPADQEATSSARPRQTVVGRGPRSARRLAPTPGLCPARERHPLASAGLAPLLALALPQTTGPATPQRRGVRTDRDDDAGQSALGQRTHPRRIAEAWTGCLETLDPALQTARTREPIQPDLAHVPGQPRPPCVGCGPAHGADPHVQDPVRARVHRPWPAAIDAR